MCSFLAISPMSMFVQFCSVPQIKTQLRGKMMIRRTTVNGPSLCSRKQKVWTLSWPLLLSRP